MDRLLEKINTENVYITAQGVSLQGERYNRCSQRIAY